MIDGRTVVPLSELPPGTPDAPPGYVWVYQAPPSEPRWKAPRWLIALTVLWALVLVVSGTVYALRGKPTVREQTTIGDAQPTVDRAVDNTVRAAGPGPLVVLGPFVKSSDCDITPVRGGVEYIRTLDLYGAPGSESTTLRTIAEHLPPSYAARSGPGTVLDLTADAGNYVGLIGDSPRAGEVEIKTETGCREPGRVAAGPAAPSLAAPEMAPVRAVLAALRTTATSTAAAQIACVGAPGVLRTVSASVPAGRVTAPLDTTLAGLTAHAATSGPNVFAYRSGNQDVVVTKDPTGVTVAVTTRCA